MKKFNLAFSLMSLLAASAVHAQAPAPSPSAPPASKPSSSPVQAKPTDPVDIKFMTVDKDKSGLLEGTELDSYKAELSKIDTNKDGKVSKEEFNMAMKTGLIK